MVDFTSHHFFRRCVSAVRLREVPLAAVFFAVIVTAASCCAEPKPRLIEVKDGESTYVGKVVARNSDQCFLIDRFGAMNRLTLSQLESFNVIGETYNSSSAGEFRQALLQEFKSGYEIQTSAHYVVAGRKGRARAYASLFEEIYRQVDSFYTLRGFQTSAPDVMLVAIVFGTQQEFREYCSKDQVLWSDDLRGYYSLKTNRVALYEDSDAGNSLTTTSHGARTRTSGSPASQTAASVKTPAPPAVMRNNVAGATASTIVHETTHQVGYNIGIHSRLGETPVWVIEGLATVLEAPGIRTRGKSASGQKINRERLEWFSEEYQSRRQSGDLAKMVAADDMFRNQTLDAYSKAWAFTWFLTENPARARLFMTYLHTLAERDSLKVYTPEERLRDFQAVFGDIARLEVDYIRAMDRLEMP